MSSALHTYFATIKQNAAAQACVVELGKRPARARCEPGAASACRA